jgi:hypothetical protein
MVKFGVSSLEEAMRLGKYFILKKKQIYQKIIINRRSKSQIFRFLNPSLKSFD